MNLKGFIHNWLVLAFIPVIAGMMGCSSTGQYFSHRRQDALDVITIGVGMGYGAKARMGPLQTGLLLDLPWAPIIRGGEIFPDIAQPHSGVPLDHDIQLLIAGVEISESGKSRGKGFKAETFPAGLIRPNDYTIRVGDSGTWNFPFVHLPSRPCPPYFTETELVFGAILSLRIGFNPGELLDFLLGWTTFDMYGDDIKSKSNDNKRVMVECKPSIRIYPSVTRSRPYRSPETEVVSTNNSPYLIFRVGRAKIAAPIGEGLYSLLNTNEVYTFTLNIRGFAPSEEYSIARVENSGLLIFNVGHCYSPIPPDLATNLISAVQQKRIQGENGITNVYINAHCSQPWSNIEAILNILSSHGLKLERISKTNSVYRVIESDADELKSPASKTQTITEPPLSTGKINQVRLLYPRAYEKWSSDEDAILRDEYQQGHTVDEIAERLQRQVGSIRSRLKKQGLIEK